jgi:uncharacterized repeat protein (TIGR01451 family)
LAEELISPQSRIPYRVGMLCEDSKKASRKGQAVRPFYVWIAILALLTIAAWQGPEPLALTVEIEPRGASTGETLSFRFVIANTGDSSLEGVVVRVVVPEGLDVVGTSVPDGWSATPPSAQVIEEVVYRSEDEMAPGARAELMLKSVILQEPGQTIQLDEYSATADGLPSPVRGAPVTLWVARAPTPTPSPTPPPPTQTAVPSPTPTATPTPTPTQRADVVFPTLTPTPNLSSEQERIGTVTVSIFVGIVVILIALSVTWVLRTARRGPTENDGS